MVLTKILEANAKKYANSLALTMRMGFRTVNMTYREVYDVSRKMALLLEQEGVGNGDKVLLLAPNSPYWICSFWGCLLRGAVVVPLNIQSTPELVEKIAKETDAKLFLAHRYYKHDSPKCVSPNNLKRYDLDVIKEFLNGFDPEEYKQVESSENDLVEILYTSGTTGDPKGVMLTHANLYSNIQAISQILSIKKGKERFLSILPLSHILEQAIGFLLPFSYGKQIIYAHSLAAIRDLLKKHEITKMLAVPEFLKLMMVKIEDQAEQRGRKKLLEKLMRFSLRVGSKRLARFLFHSIHKNLGGKLDTIICGGAPLDPVLEKKWNALGVFLIQGYGLTETAPLVTANTYDQHRFGSVGIVVPGVQVRITSGGQVEVKGPNVFQGYFKDEQKTKEVFSDDGWFKTGDIGELDSDGFLFLKGRQKYMILGSGGQNVFPEDLENTLKKVGGFKDCTVVGVPTKSGQTHIHAIFLGPFEFLDTPGSAWYSKRTAMKE
ncbi:MAG: AMP-binding protein, partial [Desulfuromonadales bacterium]|nr:AMP-binding protein [Desulfuromonadales bacterium]